VGSVGLGRFLGFLTAWNLWAYTILIMATFGVMIATNPRVPDRPLGATIARRRGTRGVSAVSIVGAHRHFAVFGVRVSKWLPEHRRHDADPDVQRADSRAVHRTQPREGRHYHPLTMARCRRSRSFSLNIFGKMALGALSGFEYVAILAGECRNPARRSAVRHVEPSANHLPDVHLGTNSVLALVPQDQIDWSAPYRKRSSIGFAGSASASRSSPVLIQSAVASDRQRGVDFAGNTRLPMVAGWDGLLPRGSHAASQASDAAHSILFVGALTLAMAMVGQLGRQRPGGLPASGECRWHFLYAFTYLAMFAIPFVRSASTA
jgi:amino acid transporter